MTTATGRRVAVSGRDLPVPLGWPGPGIEGAGVILGDRPPYYSETTLTQCDSNSIDAGDVPAGFPRSPEQPSLGVREYLRRGGVGWPWKYPPLQINNERTARFKTPARSYRGESMRSPRRDVPSELNVALHMAIMPCSCMTEGILGALTWQDFVQRHCT